MCKLVSIITPCYNGEQYLDRYFGSILSQTYPSIELIFINDGSTDRTGSIAMNYKPELERKGYVFKYIYQENAGQSAAINKGLEHFTGDYLNWFDSDDYIPRDSVEKRVDYLERHPDVGLVVGRAVVVEDITYKPIGLIRETSLKRVSTKSLVEDLLGEKFNCCCCCSMVRSEMFRSAMPDPLKIDAPREIGQNTQLFMPMMFRYPVRYVKDVLGYYVFHTDSHSHVAKNFEQRLHIVDVSVDVLNGIAEGLRVDRDTAEWFRHKICEYGLKSRLRVMHECRCDDGLEDTIELLRSSGCYDMEARRMVCKMKYPVLRKAGDLLWKLRHI